MKVDNSIGPWKNMYKKCMNVFFTVSCMSGSKMPSPVGNSHAEAKLVGGETGMVFHWREIYYMFHKFEQLHCNLSFQLELRQQVVRVKGLRDRRNVPIPLLLYPFGYAPY
ncbi:hypothetical protein HOLleu_07061 [Holothuria leucospilota]|uniref:Uncharacterized protein n=1 Tax=Holothuria leucospilota TaxID=206669 RepID=A0A9Q1CG63_HOLLE|nr:hypothetical protein HOLleu_07061 [Holothuria leucospilota]